MRRGDPIRYAHLAERLAEFAADDPRWLRLNEKLLALGGEAIVPIARYFDQREPSVLSRRARLFDGKRSVQIRGEAGSCHHNTAALYAGVEKWRFLGQADLPRVKIVTGWALSPKDDPVWRAHSWGLRPDGVVVETTEPRRLYYGVVLTPEEGKKFVKATGVR